MNLTVKEVVEAFDLLFSSLHRKDFTKTLKLNEYGERELLPLVRTYFLGYFGESLIPEAKSNLPGSLSGNGYNDFVIGNVAVELAVRKPAAAKSNVSATVNSTEVKKLMKYDGLSLIVLFDFSKPRIAKTKSKVSVNGRRLEKVIIKNRHSMSRISMLRSKSRRQPLCSLKISE